MTVRRAKQETASLLSFLRTGEMGPLKLGMTMREVSNLLGPPGWWSDGGHDEPVYLFWIYGRYLEILFDPEPPYLLKVIKLVRLPALQKRYVQIGRLQLYADGFEGEIGLAALLQREIWGQDNNVVVGLCRDWNPVIDICSSKVRLVWGMSTQEEELLEEEMSAGLSSAGYVARRDELSDGFFGIYSTAMPIEDRAPLTGWQNFSVQEYLVLIEGQRGQVKAY